MIKQLLEIIFESEKILELEEVKNNLVMASLLAVNDELKTIEALLHQKTN